MASNGVGPRYGTGSDRKSDRLKTNHPIQGRVQGRVAASQAASQKVKPAAVPSKKTKPALPAKTAKPAAKPAVRSKDKWTDISSLHPDIRRALSIRNWRKRRDHLEAIAAVFLTLNDEENAYRAQYLARKRFATDR